SLAWAGATASRSAAAATRDAERRGRDMLELQVWDRPPEPEGVGRCSGVGERRALTKISFVDGKRAASGPQARSSLRPHREGARTLRRGGKGRQGSRLGSEEVADVELELHGLVEAGAAVEGEAPLEAQRTDRAEPADACSHGVEETERQPVLLVLEEALVHGVGVAHVVEEQSAQAGGLEDGELQLHVGPELLVAADRVVTRVGVAVQVAVG